MTTTKDFWLQKATERGVTIHALRAENARLREALEGAASALDAGLNSSDASGASDAMDDALLQARAALNHNQE